MDQNVPANTLDKLSTKESAVVTGFLGSPERIERLRELGFAEDIPVALAHHNPFGHDPIAVDIGSMRVALRREDAALVQIEITR